MNKTILRPARGDFNFAKIVKEEGLNKLSGRAARLLLTERLKQRHGAVRVSISPIHVGGRVVVDFHYE